MEIPVKGILTEGNVRTCGNSSQIMAVSASLFDVYGGSIYELEGFTV